MSIPQAVRALVGDYAIYGGMADRIEGLVDAQLDTFMPNRSNWMVLPWQPAQGPRGFFLFSEDREGQRRGREVVNGFLGPSIARLVTIPDEELASALNAEWVATGLLKASLVQRLLSATPDEMLCRLEDAVATVAGRPAVTAEIHPNHVDLLRDVRLAMLGRDAVGAQRLLDQIILTGELSAENLRFLSIELLASFGRWAEMSDLPYIRAMMQARRPRAVTESILQMIWWTEIAHLLGTHSTVSAFQASGVIDRFGGVLRAIEVPATPFGRILGILTAQNDGDTERRAAIIAAAEDATEAATLEALVAQPTLPPEPEREPETPLVMESIRSVFELGKYTKTIELFLDEPMVRDADLAVQAVLDLGGHDRAADVLAVVEKWVAAGELEPTRRLVVDLAALGDLVSGACSGWLEWAQRIGSDEHWGDSVAVLRNESEGWEPLGNLTASQIYEIAEGILGAIGSTNEHHLRAGLDVLCRAAAKVVVDPACAPFYEIVLEFLAIQENVSSQVRDAYVTLFEAILEAGPPKAAYDGVLTKTAALWERIKARQHVDWALEILDATAGASAPAQDRRDAFGAAALGYLRSLDRLSFRQRVEIESLAPEFGLPAMDVQSPVTADEASIWSKLDGTVVGLYSLLSQAVPRFSQRLQALCSPEEVVGNTDSTATSALINLATRADHMVVDTWHAAHQATGAIDSVRARSRQILPQQRGVTGFLRALENSLEN